MAEKLDDLRSGIAASLNGWMTREQLSALLDRILAFKKKARHEFVCKKCGQRQLQYVEIDDAVNVVKAIGELANQGFGRPKEAQVSEAERITFTRVSR